ncbi:MAG: hypothetical protein OXQ86_06625 [Gammaproteobacteria bacterium]|nr:hypothetical protein [Gammaproteobacteria bacterium]MDE0413124.1 hypothetical protein [Gammaproteobacteria bacterium]
MKKVIAVAAVIGLAVGLTWAAEQVGGWLGFAQQDTASTENQSADNEDVSPGNEGVLPSEMAGIAAEVEAQTEGDTPASPVLSEEVASIEEDLARIEEALQSEEVLEEFTPSEPLSADNPIAMPTDI